MTDQPVVIGDSDSGETISNTLLVLVGLPNSDDVFGIAVPRFRASMQEGIDFSDYVTSAGVQALIAASGHLRRDLSNPVSPTESARTVFRGLISADKAILEFAESQSAASLNFDRWDRVRLWTGKLYLCTSAVVQQVLSGIPTSSSFREIHVQAMTDAQVVDGSDSDPMTPSAAQLRLAVVTHGVAAAVLSAAIEAHNVSGDAHEDIRALISANPGGVTMAALTAAILAHNISDDAHADIRALIAGLSVPVTNSSYAWKLLRPGSDPTKLLLQVTGTLSPSGYDSLRSQSGILVPHYVSETGFSLNVDGAFDFQDDLGDFYDLIAAGGNYDSLLNRPIVRGTVAGTAATAANADMLLLDTGVMRLYRNILHRGHDATASWRDFTSADLRVAGGESTLTFVGVRGSFLDVNTAAAQPGDVFYLRSTDHFVRWNGSVLLTLGLPKHVQGQFVTEAQALHQLADDVGSGNGVGYFAAYDVQGALRQQATVRITTAYTAPTADTREWLDLQRGLVEGLASLAAQAASLSEDVAVLRSSAVRVKLNTNSSWNIGSSWLQTGCRFDDADLLINESGWVRGTSGGNNYVVVPAGGGGVYMLSITVNYSAGSSSGDRAAVSLRSRIAFNNGGSLRGDAVVGSSYYRGGSQSGDVDHYTVSINGLVNLEAGDWVSFEAQAFETVSLDLDAGSFMSLARV